MNNKILIIEDDPFLGDVLSKKLENAGYSIKLVRTGSTALAEMKDFVPALVLLDIMLPAKNGYEILEEKAADPAISAIPVIIVSNSGQKVEMDRTIALGVKDYIIKAKFNPQEVIDKVGEYAKPAPVAGNDARPVGQAAAAGSSLSGVRIMWIEDDSFLSDIIARRLVHSKCELIHETNGETAMRTIHDISPDIVVLDLILPGMSGFEILEKIRADSAFADMPVIILSNLGQQKEIDKALAMGADVFLVKAAVTLDEIIANIERLVPASRKKKKATAAA